jgi:glycosyltransferase involved in cell wall biosynthesis
MPHLMNSVKSLAVTLPITEHQWDPDIMPLVSITCITFNHERFIHEAIMGFLKQETTFPVEILVNDDASTDRTAEVVREFEKRYPQLIFPIYQETNQFSQGINPFLGFLFPRARGKYIALCEGDDYWVDPLKLQKQVNVLLKHPDTIICGARARTWNDNKREFTVITPDLDKDISCMTPEQFFYFGTWVKTCTRIVPRELMLNIPMDYGIDYRHVHYLLANNPNGTFRCLDDVVAVYREHAGGIFSGADPLDVQKDNFESMRLIAKLYDDERAVIMRENAAHVAKELFFTRSLRIGQRLTYALQYIVLFFSNFSYLGMKRAFDRLFYRASTYLDRYPALKTHLRSFFSFVKCVGKRWG